MALDARTFEGDGEEGFDACKWLNVEIAERLARNVGDRIGEDKISAARGTSEAEHGGGNNGVPHDVTLRDPDLDVLDSQVLDYLGELEVKLQLIANDLDTNISTQTRKAYEQMPEARKELEVLRQKSGAMRKQIRSIVSNISSTGKRPSLPPSISLFLSLVRCSVFSFPLLLTVKVTFLLLLLLLLFLFD